jgi:hypothetical protein
LWMLAGRLAFGDGAADVPMACLGLGVSGVGGPLGVPYAPARMVAPGWPADPLTWWGGRVYGWDVGAYRAPRGGRGVMDTRSKMQVHGVTADHKVTLRHHDTGADTWDCLTLPGDITLYFEGDGDDNLANVLGFLDRLHAIRTALMQDRADRREVAS